MKKAIDVRIANKARMVIPPIFGFSMTEMVRETMLLTTENGIKKRRNSAMAGIMIAFTSTVKKLTIVYSLWKE